MFRYTPERINSLMDMLVEAIRLPEINDIGRDALSRGFANGHEFSLMSNEIISQKLRDVFAVYATYYALASFQADSKGDSAEESAMFVVASVTSFALGIIAAERILCPTTLAEEARPVTTPWHVVEVSCVQCQSTVAFSADPVKMPMIPPVWCMICFVHPDHPSNVIKSENCRDETQPNSGD